MKALTLGLILLVSCLMFAALPAQAQGPGVTVATYNPGSDYCQNSSIAKTSAVVNISTATTTELVAAVSGKKVYVCSFESTTGGTSPTALFKTGTKVTNPCDTSAANLSGTFAPPTAVSFNITGRGVLMTSIASGEICLTSGGTTPAFQGILTYVQK